MTTTTWSIREEITDRDSSKNALGKARNDIYHILKELGCQETVIRHPKDARHEAGTIQKAIYHFTEAKKWKAKTTLFQEGDAVIIQYPPINHTVLFSSVVKMWNRIGVRSVAFIHDLELIRHAADKESRLRKRVRIWLEETSVIRKFDYIVVHNERMKEYLCDRHSIAQDKVLCLDIFDYLSDISSTMGQSDTDSAEVVIAGNLSPGKAGYVYKLPAKPSFNLYGANYKEYYQSNVSYRGAFEADELIGSLKGKYGLIWDGNSPDTCGGVYGHYLMYNNPHKTSLYLAAGIPVLIWEGAAMAAFVKNNQCGFVIRSLKQIEEVINSVSPEQYEEAKRNAIRIGNQLRQGKYTRRIIDRMQLLSV